MNSADADRQIEQMIAFIAQEAKEKAEEIAVKTEKEFMADKLSLETQLRYTTNHRRIRHDAAQRRAQSIMRSRRVGRGPYGPVGADLFVCAAVRVQYDHPRGERQEQEGLPHQEAHVSPLQPFPLPTAPYSPSTSSPLLTVVPSLPSPPSSVCSAKSKSLTDARFSTMRRRDEKMNELKSAVLEKLAAVSSSKEYPTLLRFLMAQGLMTLLENNVTVQVRKEDLAIARKELPEAIRLFQDTMTKSSGIKPTINCALDEKEFLPPAPVAGREGASCTGGVLLSTRSGQILCRNTLDHRLELAFDALKPTLRGSLFGVRAKVSGGRNGRESNQRGASIGSLHILTALSLSPLSALCAAAAVWLQIEVVQDKKKKHGVSLPK